mgnify:CR=1 FL=1
MIFSVGDRVQWKESRMTDQARWEEFAREGEIVEVAGPSRVMRVLPDGQVDAIMIFEFVDDVRRIYTEPHPGGFSPWVVCVNVAGLLLATYLLTTAFR